MKTKSLYEILVPCKMGEKPVSTKHHKQWDIVVRDTSKGLTILKPAMGQWIHTETNELVSERMIPVRFVATENQMKQIAKFTLSHYKQHTVLCYKVSDEVYFFEN